MIEINKIYNEDCLETMKRMPDNFIDLTVTSPPYDNLRDYKGCEWNFDIFKSIAKELYRVTKDGGVVVWVVGDATINGSETGTSFKQALYFKEIGFNLHDTMIYSKPNFSFPSNNKYHQTFEYMFIFVRDKIKTFNPIKDKKNKKKGFQKTYSKRESNGNIRKENRTVDIGNFGQRYNVWEIANMVRNEANKHPAIFPEALAIDHIKSWSNKNDLIYDPFMGSGTTAVAAIKHDRQFIGSELSKEYCDIANKRIETELSQMRLF
jgi:site-specific DNA-methyltransferase (adenine-specific)